MSSSLLLLWITAQDRAAFGMQTGFYPSSGSDPHGCWHVLTSTILPNSFQTEVESFLHILYFVLSVSELIFPCFPGLANCIFSFSYCRGTIEQKSQCCFPLTHSLNTINFSFDAFLLSALIMLPQEMRANKSNPGVGEQGTDQILYNAVL